MVLPAWIKQVYGNPELLGGLLSGLVVPAIGTRHTLLRFGAIYTAATVSLLISPAMRGLDTPAQRVP